MGTLLDLRIVLVAAVVASPAAYRASQGLLSPDQAMARFVAVFLAVAATTVLVRAVWPLVAGTSTDTGTDVGEPVAEELSPPPE